MKDVVTKVLQRVPGERLGMTLASLEPSAPGSIYVSAIHSGSPSERAGVCVGWELLSVQKHLTDKLTVESVGAIVARIKGDVIAEFRTSQSERFTQWLNKSPNTNGVKTNLKRQLEKKQDAQGISTHGKKVVQSQREEHSQSQDDKIEKPSNTTRKQQTKSSTKHKGKISAPPLSDEGSEGEKSPKKKAPRMAKGQRSISDFVVPTPPAESSPPPLLAANTTRRSRAENAKMNMVIQRLMTMGFKREDALLSYEKAGPDTDNCMIWLISYIEERKFQNDLNKAQIASELQKRTDDSHLKEKAEEIIRETASLRTLFPQSLVFADSSNLSLMQNFLDNELTKVSAENKLRQQIVELFTLETKARKWYGRPAECYIVQVLKSLESLVAQHKPTQCCCSTAVQDNCELINAVAKEIADLKHHMFDMPTNTGGIPEAFIKADETMHFSLEDDGFEVIEVEQEETHDVE